MEDRPWLFVSSLVLLLVAAIVAASFLSGSSGPSPVSTSSSTKSLRAKKGSQRENAKALVSNREYTGDHEGTSDKPVEVWGRFDSDGGKSGKDPSNEARHLAEEVLEDLRPGEGIAVLEAKLRETDTPSEIYGALATLYARTEPYDEERVEGAFALALLTARTPEERLNAIYRQAKDLSGRQNPERMLDLLARTRPDRLEFSARLVEIEIMRANAQAASGDLAGATRTLDSVLSHEKAAGNFDDPAFQNAYRQAGLRLMRLYRESGEEKRAVSVGKTIKARLRAMSN